MFELFDQSLASANWDAQVFVFDLVGTSVVKYRRNFKLQLNAMKILVAKVMEVGPGAIDLTSCVNIDNGLEYKFEVFSQENEKQHSKIKRLISVYETTQNKNDQYLINQIIEKLELKKLQSDHQIDVNITHITTYYQTSKKTEKNNYNLDIEYLKQTNFFKTTFEKERKVLIMNDKMNDYQFICIETDVQLQLQFPDVVMSKSESLLKHSQKREHFNYKSKLALTKSFNQKQNTQQQFAPQRETFSRPMPIKDFNKSSTINKNTNDSDTDGESVESTEVIIRISTMESRDSNGNGNENNFNNSSGSNVDSNGGGLQLHVQPQFESNGTSGIINLGFQNRDNSISSVPSNSVGVAGLADSPSIHAFRPVISPQNTDINTVNPLTKTYSSGSIDGNNYTEHSFDFKISPSGANNLKLIFDDNVNESVPIDENARHVPVIQKLQLENEMSKKFSSNGHSDRSDEKEKCVDEDDKLHQMVYHAARQKILMRHIYARMIEFVQYSDTESDSDDDDDQRYCKITVDICKCSYSCCHHETKDSEKTIEIIHKPQ